MELVPLVELVPFVELPPAEEFPVELAEVFAVSISQSKLAAVKRPYSGILS